MKYWDYWQSQTIDVYRDLLKSFKYACKTWDILLANKCWKLEKLCPNSKVCLWPFGYDHRKQARAVAYYHYAFDADLCNSQMTSQQMLTRN